MKIPAFPVLVFLLAFSALNSQSVRLVEEENHPRFGSLQLSGLDKEVIKGVTEWSKVFRVDYKAPQGEERLPSMLGIYTADQEAVFFTPRFPFVQGHTYTITLSPPLPALTLAVSVPVRNKAETPQVETIYPSAAEWPANQLKFYVVFSQPMRYGQAMEHIRLEYEDGNTVEAPFLDMGQELWDPGRRRLTVWFDPGRIKSLLIPNLEKGPPLAPGRTYRLIIGKDWMAANGITLGQDVVKGLISAPRDTLKPKPEEWVVKIPAAGTNEPIRVDFGYSMDYALLLDGIVLTAPGGMQPEGRVEIGPEEKEWQFTPEKPWNPGKYTLRFSCDLEDLAGNNLDRVFDAPPSEKQEHSLPFYEREIDIK